MDIIAHRGCSLEAPENTGPSFSRAWEAGASACELDVRLSRDGQLFVFHDATLDRICGRPGEAEALNWAEIARLDAGAWKDPAWRGVGVPLLSEVLADLPPCCRLYIETKSGPHIARPLASLLRTSGRRPDEMPLLFLDISVLEIVHATAPEYPAYAGYECAAVSRDEADSALDGWITHACGLALKGLSLEYAPWLDGGRVARIHDAGLRLLVWTVNEPSVAARCQRDGVDGLITDDPRSLLRLS